MSQLLDTQPCPVCGVDVPIHIEPSDFLVDIPICQDWGHLTQYCPACNAELTYKVFFAQIVDYYIDGLVEVNGQPAASMAVEA